MDANPFRTARGYLTQAPAKWAAVLASVAAAVCLAALLPVLYLFVDLLVTQGYVPRYDQLPVGRQLAFQREWDDGLAAELSAEPDLAPLLAAGGAADVGWGRRWEAAVYQWLRRTAGGEVAEAYLPVAGAADPAAVAPARLPLGPVATAGRERGRWHGRLIAATLPWVPWAWRPGAADRPATLEYLGGLLAAAVGLVVARGLLVAAAARFAAECTHDAVTRVRRAVFTHSHRLPAVAVRADAQAEAGDLLAGRAEALQDGFLAWLTGGFRGPAAAGLFLAAVLVTHVWLGVAAVLVGGLVWVAAGRLAARFRADARRAARRAESRLALLRETLSVGQLVKGYLMDRYAQTRVERHLADLGRAAWRRQRGDAVSRSAALTVPAVVGLVVAYLAARVVLAGDLSVAGLAVMAAALGGLAAAVGGWVAAGLRIARARGAAADLLEFLDRRGEPGQPIDAEFLQPLAKRLDLTEVSLREAGTGRMLLEGVTLSVPAGSRAAVVAADPAEGHAVAYLLARFLEPTGGDVRVDGKNIRWVTTESLRTQVALVLEPSLTFTDTAANNIGCGDPGFSLPQIIEAAKRAHAHQFIQALPYGYETRIGGGGVDLTVGQRLRVALARALLRDPSLLVLEEPADPLDPDSRALLDDALAQLPAKLTVLFLARRPATVRAADRVFVIHHGRLVAAGRHDELLTGSDLYRQMHAQQPLVSV